MLGTIILILVLLALLGGTSVWPVIPYGYGAGHYGMGGLVLVLILVLVLLAIGRL